jgi:mannose-6-phosphate isomerase-like protein (cupin superfamily)
MKVSIDQALRHLPAAPTAKWPEGVPFVTVMSGAAMSVEVFAPRGADHQQPHSRDELYIIHRGTARLRIGSQSFDCATGDALFVAAGEEHRFEVFSDDFVTWVVFCGP